MLWLEKWLAAYPGTVMLISHDTEFLDAVAKSILHFDHAKLVRYRGGYNDYLTQRAERLRLGNIAYERQQREAASCRASSTASRPRRPRPSRRRAGSRPRAHAGAAAGRGRHRYPHSSPDQVPDPLLTLEHLSAGYTDAAGNTVPILRDVTLMVRAGSRVGAGRQRRRQEHADQDAGRRAAGAASAAPRAGWPSAISTSTSSTCWTWTARRWRTWRLAPEARARAAAQLPGRLRLLRRHGQRQGRPHVRRRKLAGAVAHRLAKAQPAAAGRTQQPPGRGNPRGSWPPRWRQHAAGLARPAPAAHHGGQLDRGRRRRARVRRRPEDYRDWLAARNAGERAEARENAAPIPSSTARPSAAPRPNSANASPPPQAAGSQARQGRDRDGKAARQLQALDATIADPDLYSDERRAERQKVMAEHGEHGKRMDELEEQWLELQGSLEEIGSPKPDGKRRGRPPFLTAVPCAYLISIIIIIYTSSRIWL